MLVPTFQPHGFFPWKKYIWTSYEASTLTMVGSVFRVVEYPQGNGGTLLHHKAYIYIHDVLPMFAVMIVFIVVHSVESPVGLKGLAGTRSMCIRSDFVGGCDYLLLET